MSIGYFVLVVRYVISLGVLSPVDARFNDFSKDFQQLWVLSVSL